MTSRFDQWRLRLYTAANMRPKQLAGIAERRLRHTVIPSLPVDFDARYDQCIPPDPSLTVTPVAQNTTTLRGSLTSDERIQYRKRAEAVCDGEISFLNRSITFDDPTSVEWDHEKFDAYPRLWRLKLHGFVPLSWAIWGYDRPPADLNTLFDQWIHDWISAHTIGDGAYLRGEWTPYAVSLRLINWCRYLAWRTQSGDNDEFSALRQAIYKHAMFLRNHLEHDVGGNHLIENGAALIMAGALMDGPGRAWLDDGVAVLQEAAETQFLDDGGHFERSPMYHLLTLERYLTALDLLTAIGYPVPSTIRATTEAAADFVLALRPPDDRIPLLNDAVFDEAHSLPSILAYAKQIGILTETPRSTEPNTPENISLPSTGYYWLGNGADRLLIDGGVAGPAHLPGHAHNDFLQILLWVDGRRLLTDTGVYHYAPDEYRTDARSVRSHNTVQVGSTEPVDIGGRYLRGRRICPVVAVNRCDHGTVFDGQYEVYSGLTRDYTHRRRVISRDQWWLVFDDVESTSPTTIHSRLHLAPDAEIMAEDSDNRFTLSMDDATCWIYPLNANELVQDMTSYYPEFGVKERRQMVDIRVHNSDSAHFGFLISTERHTAVELNRTGQILEGMWLDGKHERLPQDTRPKEIQ